MLFYVGVRVFKECAKISNLDIVKTFFYYFSLKFCKNKKALF